MPRYHAFSRHHYWYRLLLALLPPRQVFNITPESSFTSRLLYAIISSSVDLPAHNTLHIRH